MRWMAYYKRDGGMEGVLCDRVKQAMFLALQRVFGVSFFGVKRGDLVGVEIRIYVGLEVVAVGSGGADSKEMSGNILRFGFLWENVFYLKHRSKRLEFP
ncbi:BTB/POZ domain-containing NPY2-like protein [Gossypium australe]|uniref:BTB/POZ domain-containing NPY2-like protein n=1 Tax=Gossypium australe TaxID=47621 RepID=A0A5B6VYE2_9ROSI|nr:BTB/POZ domain-containing NPY2-like protein [Gossypium australe]